jgi:DNA-binding beta-propeller fold protein YncE
MGTGPGEFFGIGRAAINTNEKQILAVDEAHHRIQVFDFHGNFLFSFGKMGGGDGEFMSLTDIEVNHNDNQILVADQHNYRVQVFDSRGTFLFKFGSFGTDDDQFSGPEAIAYHHGHDRIIVCDKHDTLVFDKKGNYLFKLFPYGDHHRAFAYPSSVIVDEKTKHILILDRTLATIFVYDSATYDYLYCIENDDMKASDITVDRTGNIIMCEPSKLRVQICDASGNPIHRFPVNNQPMCICFNSLTGQIVVVVFLKMAIRMY